MAKRGYKLQEFVAHSANVNCVKIGKKTCRHFVSGGDDEIVNLWSIGKQTSIASLSGHTSPIESVAFNPAEVLVAAGASSGVVKIWDLEETKVVRTLNGHRSYCTSVEFHPFGEFFASGSMDTSLKIWDIRKKECLHTYKGHKRAISTIKFTPDGRWVVSGGLDNVVKIWDLTAGKLLHELKFHEGHIKSMDFHPLEFLLATGSSDKTVKFWDLETFELIGSTQPEATGVRSITFHPDGRTLFCALDSSLKVYSWEPVICHDAVDIGWSMLGDICINDGKLLGCSYFQNSIGVWAADVSQIEPYSKSPKKTSRVEPKSDLHVNHVERVETVKSSFTHSDDNTKEIKNIYVDSMTAVASRKPKSLSKVVHLTSPKETNTLRKHKHTLAAENIEQKNSFVYGNVPPDNSDMKDLVKSRKKLVAGSTGKSLKPPHRGRPSSTKSDVEELSAGVETLLKSGSDTVTNTNIQRRLFTDDTAKDASREKTPTSTCSKSPSRRTLPNDNCDVPVGSKKGLKSVKYVNGVAVMNGRTHSLVEKFEYRDNLDTDECHKSDTENVLATTVQQSIDVISSPIPEATTSPMQVTVPDTAPYAQYVAKTSRKLSKTPDLVSSPESEATKSSTITHKKPDVVSSAVTEAKRSQMVKSPDLCREKLVEANTSPLLVKTPKTSPNMVGEKAKASSTQRSVVSRRVIPENFHSSQMLVTRRSRTPPHMIHERTRTSPVSTVSRHNTSTYMTTMKEDIPQTTGRCMTSKIDDDLAEDLMLDHDLSLSTLRSRLTKLQVVKQFWQRNDMMGAISVLQKLPDHAVQADVISVMLNNIESLTLDLFSCLLPILLGLLNSEIERHINVSLEMLLKLVVAFGSVITSTASAPPAVGVDLNAEKRLESCNQCHVHLQKLHRILPHVIRRGGLTARSAQELNFRLQQS